MYFFSSLKSGNALLKRESLSWEAENIACFAPVLPLLAEK